MNSDEGEFIAIYAQVKSALARQQYVRAKHLQRQLIKLKSDESLYHWMYGFTCLTLKLYKTAAASFKRAIRLQKDCAPAWAGLGQAYMELRDWKKANNAFARSQTIRESSVSYVMHAAVLNRVGDYEQAKENCNKALHVNHLDCEAYYHLGDSYRGLGDRAQAIHAYETAISLCPANSDAYRQLGIVQYEWSRLPDAEESLQRASRLCESDVLTHFYLAKIALDHFDVSSAHTEFRYILQLAVHEDSDLVLEAAELISGYANAEIAEELFRKAIKVNPIKKTYNAYCGWLIYHGRCEEAHRLLENAGDQGEEHDRRAD